MGNNKVHFHNRIHRELILRQNTLEDEFRIFYTVDPRTLSQGVANEQARKEKEEEGEQ